MFLAVGDAATWVLQLLTSSGCPSKRKRFGPQGHCDRRKARPEWAACQALNVYPWLVEFVAACFLLLVGCLFKNLGLWTTSGK